MKKVEFYKLYKNNNGYFLAKGEGIKKTFDYEGEKITIYFEKNDHIWNTTEEKTGLSVLFVEKSLNEAVSIIQEILPIIFHMIKSEECQKCADILSKLKSELEDKNDQINNQNKELKGE